MHLAALWQWPSLTPFDSPILRLEKRSPARDFRLNSTAVDFEDTSPAFISLERRGVPAPNAEDSAGAKTILCATARPPAPGGSD